MSASFLVARLVYLAPMELQTQIDELKASMRVQKFAIAALSCVIVAGVGIAAIQPVGDATFDTITCKEWRVVDKDGKTRIGAGTSEDGQASVGWLDKDEKVRIAAATSANGQASVELLDKDEKTRIGASTLANGNAGVRWLDKDEKTRINAGTLADGQASVLWFDKDGKGRIGAGTLADGTVFLPTEDLKK